MSLNFAFEAVHSYNNAPARNEEFGSLFGHTTKILGAKERLTEAEVDPEVAQASLEAVEIAAWESDQKVIAGYAKLELSQALGAIGLGTENTGFGYMLPSIEDNTLFAQSLAQAEQGALSPRASAEMATMFAVELENASLVAAGQNLGYLLGRYPRSGNVLENYPEVEDTDTARSERQRRLFDGATQFAPHLRRLNVAADTIATVEALVDAEKAGTLPEFSLLQLMGAFETDAMTLGNTFVGSWYMASQWKPLDEVVEGLRLSYPRSAYASLGTLLPRTLEKIINPEPRPPLPIREEDKEWLIEFDTDQFTTPEQKAADQAFIDRYKRFLQERQLEYSLL